jgi:hypothetical protein
MARRQASMWAKQQFSASPCGATFRTEALDSMRPWVATGTTVVGPGPNVTFPLAGSVSLMLRNYAAAGDPGHIGAGGPLSEEDRSFLRDLGAPLAAWKNYGDLKESRETIKSLPPAEAKRILTDGDVGALLAKGVPERKVRNLVKLGPVAQRNLAGLNAFDVVKALDLDVPVADKLLAFSNPGTRTKLLERTTVGQLTALLNHLDDEPESEIDRFVDKASSKWWMFDLDKPDKRAALRLLDEHPRLAEWMTKQGFHGLKNQDETILRELENLRLEQYRQRELEYVRSGMFRSPRPRSIDVYNQGTVVETMDDLGRSLTPGIGRACFTAVWSGKTVWQTLREGVKENLTNAVWRLLARRPSQIRETLLLAAEVANSPEEEQAAVHREGLFKIFVLNPLLALVFKSYELLIPICTRVVAQGFDAYIGLIVDEDEDRFREGTSISTTNTDS